MNAIDLLETQHRDVDELFARLQKLEGDARKTAFDDLADLLAIHAAIEELHFYPAVKAARSEEIVEHSLEEHVGIKRKLALCMATSVYSDPFLARLLALQKEVQHHVGEERRDLFPKVRRVFDGDQLEALGQEMTSTMAELQKGRPRFDVPLQTIAPMPAASLPTQSALGSRIIPRLARVIALPMQLFGAAAQLAKVAAGFVRGMRRGTLRKREA